MSLLAAPLLAAPLLAGAASPSSAAPAGLGDAASAIPGLDQPVTVTLITGDRVTVRPGAGATVEPGAGREHVTFLQTDGGDKITVMPSDAAQLVAEGRLDERLFDVSYLIEEGLDDASRDSVPLLLEGQPDQFAAAVVRQLPLTAMSAVTWDKATAAQLWSQLPKPKASQPGARGRSADATLLPLGVDKVWLDAMVDVVLDESVPMIGAPEAWQAGYDGDGVTVAVLDSGIDATHPDLAGKVTAAANFTPEPSAADGNGHGTHVASTIAGSGAASGGRYNGVAPGASLLNGKVCNSSGGCATSWVLAGMEWAVANGADVINMSLGGAPTDGSDPLSQAVNALTAASGALFVVAAGNSGPGQSTVAAPGSADAALTVGALHKHGPIAYFSSQGPRFRDHAVKPDIAAPGVAIVAARAAGTSLGAPVDDRYTALDGTSMATPHVAGAAAILAQRHPDWQAERLKAGLMTTAEPLDGLGSFEVGTGLVDVSRAVEHSVGAATPSVSFGLMRWPHEVPPTTKAVTYRNDRDAAVTLGLAVTATNRFGAPAPDGLFTLDVDQLTVPANGTASVNITMTPPARQAGTYSGRLTATGDGVVAQTALGVTMDDENFDLTVNLLDRNGNPPTAGSAWPVMFNVFEYSTGRTWLFLPHGATLHLPPGHYAVIGYVTTPRPDLPDNRYQLLDDVAELTHPDFRLTDDTVLTLDARSARKVEIEVDSPTARVRALSVNAGVKMPPSAPYPYFHFALATKFASMALGANVYVGSVGNSDRYVHLVQAVLEEPLVRLEVNGAHGFPVDVFHAEDIQIPRTPLLGANRIGVVMGGAGTTDELAAVDVRGKLVVLTIPPDQSQVLLERVANARLAGARAVLLDRSPLDPPAIAANAVPALPILLAADPQRGQLIELAGRGGTSVTTYGVAGSPYQYNLLLPTRGQIPERPVYHPSDRDLGAVAVEYHATPPPGRVEFRHAVYLGRTWGTGFQYLRSTFQPLRRTEYYSAGPVQWQRETNDGAGGPWRRTQLAEYRAGSLLRESQFAAVVGPSFASAPLMPLFDTLSPRPAWVFRQGATMDIRVPMLSDAAPNHVMDRGGRTAGFTRLYRDGALVGENAAPGIAVATVPPGEANYRLETGAIPIGETTGGRWEVSTNVTASWMFRSAATPDIAPLPLMAVRYQPSLDEHNRAPGGRPFQVPIRVEHQQGSTNAPITELVVQASYDDGRTWQPVGLFRTGESWRAVVDNPVEGFVSLRANATDADGNTVEQTIERAYGIAERYTPSLVLA